MGTLAGSPPVGPAVLLAVGSVAAFGDSVRADGLWVSLSPGVGAEGGVIGLAVKQAIGGVGRIVRTFQIELEQ